MDFFTIIIEIKKASMVEATAHSVGVHKHNCLLSNTLLLHYRVKKQVGITIINALLILNAFEIRSIGILN